MAEMKLQSFWGKKRCESQRHWTIGSGYIKNVLKDYSLSRGTAAMADRSWIDTGSDWLRITPFGFRKLLKFIKDEYGNPPIYVTENGVSERGAVDLNDIHRTYFYKNYINQGLKGIVNPLCNCARCRGPKWPLNPTLPGYKACVLTICPKEHPLGKVTREHDQLENCDRTVNCKRIMFKCTCIYHLHCTLKLLCTRAMQHALSLG